MPFVTAGDPSLAATSALIQELIRNGAHLIEVGFPYSDPIADGPVIQASYTRALANGLGIDDIFASFREARQRKLWDPAIPLVAMTAYALVYRRGLERFVADALESGLSGAIVPDLPADEAGELGAIARKRDFKIIHLVTPTTPPERARQIAEASTGFLYYVSVTGITGERRELPAELISQLAWLRSMTSVPICVGFGISKPEHVQALRGVADGVIVGSALVRCLEKAGTEPLDKLVAQAGQLARSLSHALVS